MEGSLLSIGAGECQDLLVIRSPLPKLLRGNGIDDSIFVKLNKIDWWENVRLYATAFILEDPLQPGKFFAIVCAHDLLEVPGHHGLQSHSVAKVWRCSCNLHFHREICANRVMCWQCFRRRRHRWRSSIKVYLCICYPFDVVRRYWTRHGLVRRFQDSV